MLKLLRNTALFVGLLVAVAGVARAADDRWAAVVADAANSVVSLKLGQLRNFDDARQGTSNATGFVVDAEQGIVLTNRHVVGSGPIRLSATFQNQERVDAVPLYRDPIHDFAFLRYDPAQLRYAKPRTLALRPDKVSTGLNIRVIGSDGGEQLSILTGTIARLDREVPSYGRYGYNDFNTFYLQAASSTSGGSSGSPVIDLDGDVVALNAAANTRTASSFFLPLHRIAYALERLRHGEPINRGGLQTLFAHKPFRELQRLGLDAATEAALRELAPGSNGMLTVEQVIVGGVADGILEAGDVLVSVDGMMIPDFVSLEAMLDARIGKDVALHVVRQGETLDLVSRVADLHALAPDRLLEIGDAVLQNMSIQHARAMNRAQQGVVVMDPGFFFARANIPASAVIVEVNGNPVADIDDWADEVRAAPRDRKLLMRYVVPGREYTTEIAQVDIDDRWYEFRDCSRRDDVRFWDCQKLALSRKEHPLPDTPVAVPGYKDALLDRVAPAMVYVAFGIPYTADNAYARQFSGVGLVVDKAQGLVAVDRNTVPIGLGDAEITFFGSRVVDGSVVFLHPRHNIALLKYDPAELGDADFEQLELADASRPLPEKLTMIGLRRDGTYRRHPVSDISRLTINFPSPTMPRFQQSSTDVFAVPNVPPSLGGPFVDENGDVHAVYMSFAYESEREVKQAEWAMPASTILEAVQMYQAGRPYYSLDLQLQYRTLSEASELGLPTGWLERYHLLDSEYRRVLYVVQVVPGTDVAGKLLPGDVLLAIDNELVADLFTAEQRAQKNELELTILRRGQVEQVRVRPSELSGLGTQRLVSWAGALFQEPHSEIGYFKGVDMPGVYITATDAGSPALWDGLYRNRFVTAVDGVPVDNLDDFLGQVSRKAQDEVTRLSVTSMSGRKSIVTVEPEYNFWPTFEVKRTIEGWQRINYLN